MTPCWGESKATALPARTFYPGRTMPAPVAYFDVVRGMKNPFDFRLRLVTHARQHGINAAARAFRTAVSTVRKWLRRHQAQGLKGLQELSRAPRSCPHKITGKLVRQVVQLRRQLPTFADSHPPPNRAA